MTTTTSERTHEDRLRRMAHKQGLRLRKVRRSAEDWRGEWLILDADHDWLVGPEHGLDLDGVEEWLSQPAQD